MALTYARHTKLSLKTTSDFNEAWLHDRIKEDPTILGLGDVHLLDFERRHAGAGRLDLLLFNEDDNRRYEVEVMLGATDPSHIVRTIEYWDIERRRYPGYEHIAVLVAEDITTRFLNVLGLMSGSIPLIAIQLDALEVSNSIVLNFVHVLDQTELRIDDTLIEAGGGQVDRKYWEDQVGGDLMKLCDDILRSINAKSARKDWDFNYLGQYIGLRNLSGVDNFMWVTPKGKKRIIHVGFRTAAAQQLKERFDAVDIPAKSNRQRELRITVTNDVLASERSIFDQVVEEVVRENNA